MRGPILYGEPVHCPKSCYQSRGDSLLRRGQNCIHGKTVSRFSPLSKKEFRWAERRRS